MTIDWSRFDAVLFDLDGVLRRDEEVVEGSSATISWLKEHGKQIRIVSNNSTMATEEFAQAFRSLGLPCDPIDDVILATRLFAKTLAGKIDRATVYLIGRPGLERELVGAGLRVLHEPEEIDYLCDFVAVGGDGSIDNAKLTRALRVLLKGGRFAAVNADPYLVTPHGPLPGAGAIVGAIKGMIGKDPEILVGKPAPTLLEQAAMSCGVPHDRCLMIGDSLLSDIPAAKALDMSSALVLTGITDLEMLKSSPLQPDFVLDSVANLTPN